MEPVHTALCHASGSLAGQIAWHGRLRCGSEGLPGVACMWYRPGCSKGAAWPTRRMRHNARRSPVFLLILVVGPVVDCGKAHLQVGYQFVVWWTAASALFRPQHCIHMRATIVASIGDGPHIMNVHTWRRGAPLHRGRMACGSRSSRPPGQAIACPPTTPCHLRTEQQRVGMPRMHCSTSMHGGRRSAPRW